MSCALFDQSVKKTLSFAVASDLEDVPDEPGIYAWYLPFRGDTSGDLLRYLKSLEANLMHSVPVTAVYGATKQSHFTLQRNVPAFDFTTSNIESLAQSMRPSQVQSLGAAVLALSFLSEPFYIGMTEAQNGLRSRLLQHLASVDSFDKDLRWRGSLRTRIAHTLKDPAFLSKCIIVYVPMAALDLGENASRLLEHVLIRIVSPAQSLRG